MQVILLENLDKVGAKHEVVKVKDGFGRNYLIPQGLALVANKPNMARLDGLKKQAAKKEGVIIEQAKTFAAQLDGKTLKIVAKAGESGRLFGSVGAAQIADGIKKQFDLDVDKHNISVDDVKELGNYTADIRFHPTVIVNLPFEVVGGEA
jgi:large subunit ribosomal protein L9